MKNFTLVFTILCLILFSASMRNGYAKPTKKLPAIGLTRITTQRTPDEKLLAYPSGKIFVPDSSFNYRHVNLPVTVTTCWDSIPITSFRFSVKYDYKVLNPTGVSATGPGTSCYQNSGLARNFTLTYTDVIDSGGIGAMPHRLTVTGTSTLPLGVTTPSGNDCLQADTVDLLYISFIVIAHRGDIIHSTILQIPNDTASLHWNNMSPKSLFPPDSLSDPYIGLCGPKYISSTANIFPDPDTSNRISGRGRGNLVVTQQPVIELGADGAVTPLDANNYELTTLMEADSSVHSPVSRLVTINDSVPGTRMNCLTAKSNATWLTIGNNPNSGTSNYTITPDLDYTANTTLRSEMLYVIVDPNFKDSGSGFHQGVISFSSNEASNSPANLSVTFVGTPSNITVPVDSGKSTAVVNYIQALESRDSAYVITYDPPSGSIFPIGKSTVVLTIIDRDSNEITRLFSVIVLGKGPVDTNSVNISGGTWIIGTGVTETIAGLTIQGNGIVEIDSGAILNVVGGITLADSGMLVGSGTVKLSGDLMNNSSLAGYCPDTLRAAVEFNGSTPQLISGTSMTVFTDLIINNASGVTMKKDVGIAHVITFKSGKIFTDSSTLEYCINQPGFTPIVGADDKKYIVTSKTGHVKLTVDSAFVNALVAIGDAYAPVTLSMDEVSPGMVAITSYTTTGTNPYENTPTPNASGIDQNKKCDHYWVMSKSDSGSFGSYDATFDLTYTTNTGDLSKYVIKLYDSATGWTSPSSVINGTTISVTGLTFFGDFEIGEQVASGVTSSEETLKSNVALIKSVIPNPGSSAMVFAYVLGASGDIRLELFNTLGKSVALISDRFHTKGEHECSLNVAALAEGRYYLRLTTQYGNASAVVQVIH